MNESMFLAKVTLSTVMSKITDVSDDFKKLSSQNYKEARRCRSTLRARRNGRADAYLMAATEIDRLLGELTTLRDEMTPELFWMRYLENE